MTDKTIDDLVTKCIRCGFCLESCPTFRLTGEETESPRGRIYLLRSAEVGKIQWESVQPHIDSCLGCRACETACPSGVEYGKLLELARTNLETKKPNGKVARLLGLITRPSLLRMALKVNRFVSPDLASKILGHPVPSAQKIRESHYPPLNVDQLPSVRGTVHLLEGCAMRVMFPNVHIATRRLLRRLGFEVSALDLGCCGALEAHAGHLNSATQKSNSIDKAADGVPIISNSAGCGSWMKDSGVANVFDISEFLVEHGMLDLLATLPAHELRVTYHDACHLAHGQKIRHQPRDLISAMPGVKLIEMDRSDQCCGSAGIYNFLQPDNASKLLAEKTETIRETQATKVVLGNPGCHSWIQQGLNGDSRVEVVHLAELLEDSLSGLTIPDKEITR